MSQAGIIEIENSHPQIPTSFVTNAGTAVPIGNVLEILGTIVAAHSIPLETIGSGNTVTVVTQYASAAGASVGTNAGLASFNSADFTVDANGFVTLTGAGAGQTITGNTGGPISPVAGNWNIVGTSTAAGAIPVQTVGAGNTLTIEVQKSQAIAATNAANVGLAAFNSTYFTVDANGFVSANGSHLGETITGNVGGALSPTAGNWNILGTSTAAGTTPVQTSGTGSTLTVQVQTAQAIVATNATNIGLSAFNSADFTVDANGFVSLASGAGVLLTLTGNTGGAISPTAGNINTVGTGSITIAGSGSTLTTQLTGLTNHAVLVGAGTATITKVGPTATSGQVLQSQGSTTDPAFSTATFPSTTTINQILYSSAANTVTGLAAANSAVLVSTAAGVPVWSSTMTNGQVVIGSTGATPTAATLTAGGGVAITNGAGSITIAVTGGGFTWQNIAVSTAAVAENGYVCTAALTLTLPNGPANGTTIELQVKTASAVVVQAQGSDTIRMGPTIGAAAGTATSTGIGQTAELVYDLANTNWCAQSFVGNWTVV